MSPNLFAIAATIALALTPCAVNAAGIDLHGDRVDLAVRPTAANSDTLVVGGQADLSAKLPAVQTTLQLSVENGVAPRDGALLSADGTTAREWDSRHLGLTANWAPFSRAQVDFTADAQRRSELNRGDALWFSSVDQHVRTMGSLARIQANLEPFGPLNLSFGGQVTNNTSWTGESTLTGPVVGEELRTGERQLFTTAAWRPLSRFSLEAGGKLQTIGVDWDGAGARAGDYTFVSPHVSANVAPWSGSALRFEVERRVAPINADQFASFARASDDSSSAVFTPDEEWRYQASMEQKVFGAVAVNATVTRAALKSVTDLGPVGGLQAPVDIGGGERRQFQAGLTAPLRLFGISSLEVKAGGTWRASEVNDPFTQMRRRLSGESPYQAELSLTGAAGPRTRWGVSAQAAGGATIYQMNQVSNLTASTGLSGFIRYNPGPLMVQLNLDNLLGDGGIARDTYFLGDRAQNTIDRIDERRAVDRAVRLRFDKAL